MCTGTVTTTKNSHHGHNHNHPALQDFKLMCFQTRPVPPHHQSATTNHQLQVENGTGARTSESAATDGPGVRDTAQGREMGLGINGGLKRHVSSPRCVFFLLLVMTILTGI